MIVWLCMCVDDCKHVYYRRCQATTKSGRFSQEEDQRLLLAVTRAVHPTMKSLRKTSRLEWVNSLPREDIPWEAVAIHMNHERKGELSMQ